MTTPPCLSYAGHRFPAEIISHAVWLYFRFPLSLRHVDEILAARGITVSHETVRQWGLKFGQSVANPGATHEIAAEAQPVSESAFSLGRGVIFEVLMMTRDLLELKIFSLKLILHRSSFFY
jgi:hypothetical protein